MADVTQCALLLLSRLSLAKISLRKGQRLMTLHSINFGVGTPQRLIDLIEAGKANRLHCYKGFEADCV